MLEAQITIGAAVTCAFVVGLVLVPLLIALHHANKEEAATGNHPWWGMAVLGAMLAAFFAALMVEGMPAGVRAAILMLGSSIVGGTSAYITLHKVTKKRRRRA